MASCSCRMTRQHADLPALRVGIDIGGTFTDFLLADDAAGRIWVGKTPTTPEDPSVGVARGLDEILRRAGAGGDQVATAAHGTTLVADGVIERNGDGMAVVTTRG